MGSAMKSPAERTDLHHDHEAFGRCAVDELLLFGHQLPEREHDELLQPADEDEGDDAAADERPDRDNQSLPELVEMLQKRHLPAGFVVLLFFVVRI